MASKSSKEPASAALARLIQSDIVSGTYRLGQRLVEAELAERFQTNHRVIREAFHLLEGEGLVVNHPFRGRSVFQPSRKSMESLLQIRISLEALAASIAAYRIDSMDALRLREQSQIPESGFATITDLLDWDMQIHRLIWEIAEEPQLADQLSRLLVQVMASYQQLVVTPDSPTAFLELDKEMLIIRQPKVALNHVELVEAICSRDPDLARAEMVRHLTYAEMSKEFERVLEAAFSQHRGEQAAD